MFKVPNLEEQMPNRQIVYNFDTSTDSQDVYEELNAIAEEIEQCRLKNSLI